MADEARRALITGISGQDGSFLSELLLQKGYEVTGISRGPESRPLGCSEHLRDRLGLLWCDRLDGEDARAAIAHARPHELYHLACPSFVPASWEQPALTLEAIAGSTAAILAAVREVDPATRVFVASSIAMFGDAPESPQREDTPFRPANPYSIAKLAAHQLVGALRRRDGLFACSGVLANHESERRPERFVTRKITRAAAAVKLGLADRVELGDLDAVRDWSFAGDIVQGAWLMLQQPEARDYVLASGVGHTVRQFAQQAFACLDLDAERYIHIDQALMRPAEATPNVGDPTRARRELGWSPRLSFAQLIERMVLADLRELSDARPQPA